MRKLGNKRLDLEEVRKRLDGKTGPAYWRSLEEVAGTPEFRRMLHREFPRQASVWDDSPSRRSFLKLAGATLALAGLNACSRQPEEAIVPYVRPPEALIPGKPMYFATAMPSPGGYGLGVLVESHMGRPTKVEGNPQHPSSLGATDVFAQASVLTLYDPDRSAVVMHKQEPGTWDAFLETLPGLVARIGDGLGFHVLAGNVTSPTMAGQFDRLMQKYPQARVHQYAPVNEDNARAGASMAFGRHLQCRCRLDNADVVLSIDGDFLSWEPGHVRYARDFALRRDPASQKPMNRLYALECTPEITGAMADHRLPVRPSEVLPLARAIARAAGVDVSAPELEDAGRRRWVEAVAADLQQAGPRALVVAGEAQPPLVHALAHAMNDALGAVGTTVEYTEPVAARPVLHGRSIRELADALHAGEVETLLVLERNPVYDAPVDLRFAEAIARAGESIHLGLYNDETAALCTWHLPAAHYLETWGDIRAYDGTASLIQPLIAPLYGGRSSIELLEMFVEGSEARGYDIVRAFWTSQQGAADFDRFWHAALSRGYVEGTQLPPLPVHANVTWPQFTVPAERQGFEVVLRPDPGVWDGTWANNGWLQELPKPYTKLTWDNAVLLGVRTAQRLGVTNDDVVELARNGTAFARGPVWVLPGQPEDVATVHLGYGRWRAGEAGNGAGFNAYAFRTNDAPWALEGVELRPTGERYALACTSLHHNMEGRPLVREATLPEYREHPDFARHMVHEPPEDLTMFPLYEYKGYAWGMAIDLNRCIGCNACIVACQAENNSPVVGKEQVAAGREMQWLRVDQYYKGDAENPLAFHQPVPCMHCEKAPCEVVCPVNATVHGDEGLNEMVYNRCVGTRYCSNNCPYKVRRFNFLRYSDTSTESLKPMRNPDVTVRGRGVMEKCTYCVQRINHARIDAKKEGRAIRDGEVVTACQAACPASAISFGNINDPDATVALWKKDARNYALLGDLNTRPRTTYLAKIRNPNPELEATEGHGGSTENT